MRTDDLAGRGTAARWTVARQPCRLAAPEIVSPLSQPIDAPTLLMNRATHADCRAAAAERSARYSWSERSQRHGDRSSRVFLRPRL